MPIHNHDPIKTNTEADELTYDKLHNMSILQDDMPSHKSPKGPIN